MNYCTKCKSLYSQPGTCNCFAVVGDQTIVLTSFDPKTRETIEEACYKLSRGSVLKATPCS